MLADEAEAVNERWLIARTPAAAVRDLEVRRHPRRPVGGRGRHQPVDHRPGGARRRPPAAGRVRRDHRRHRHRRWPTTRALTVRDEHDRAAAGAAAAAGGRRTAGTCRPGRAGPATTSAPTPCVAADRTTRRSVLAARCTTARAASTCWLEGGPTLAGAFLSAGLVDQVVAYLAPALLGAGSHALGDPASIDASPTAFRSSHDVDAVRRRPPAHARPVRAITDGGELMFTGIVEELGEVVALDRLAATASGSPSAGRGRRRTPATATRSRSTACCLTVVDVDADAFTADVMGETPRPHLPRRAAARRAGSTWSAPYGSTRGSAATRAGPRRRHRHDRCAASRASTGRSSRSRCPPTSPATSSRRARSPSTASR